MFVLRKTDNNNNNNGIHNYLGKYVIYLPPIYGSTIFILYLYIKSFIYLYDFVYNVSWIAYYLNLNIQDTLVSRVLLYIKIYTIIIYVNYFLYILTINREKIYLKVYLRKIII